MRRSIHKISVLFLWLAGLAFIAHITIPHDHYLTDFCSGSGEKHPVSENNSSHGNHNPFHCHSLNDLTSEKASKYIIAKYVKFLNDITSNSFINTTFYFEQWCLPLLEIPDQLPDPFLLTSSPFRAPPLFC